jgi:transposase InsO family protein
MNRLQQRISEHGFGGTPFRQSMSAKGNCYDNALADRFFYRFNAELVKVSLFKDLEQVKFGVFSYIEGYYKRV